MRNEDFFEEVGRIASLAFGIILGLGWIFGVVGFFWSESLSSRVKRLEILHEPKIAPYVIQADSIYVENKPLYVIRPDNSVLKIIP